MVGSSGETTKVPAGEDCTIMPPYASPPTASWSRKEAIPPIYIRAGRLELHAPELPPDFHPRGSPRVPS
jgi:hypothetical protein